jgi:hypothetical protein
MGAVAQFGLRALMFSQRPKAERTGTATPVLIQGSVSVALFQLYFVQEEIRFRNHELDNVRAVVLRAIDLYKQRQKAPAQRDKQFAR